jgi:hypothetical protein
MAFLRVIGKSANWYKVVVNEKKKDTKYVFRRSPNLSFYNWEEDFPESVIVDLEANPLRESPNGKAISISLEEKDYFRPVFDVNYRKAKPQGDWIEVEKLPRNQVKITGWLRWRTGDEILIRHGLSRLNVCKSE